LLEHLEGVLVPADWPGFPPRWVALKVLEEDPRVLERLDGTEEGSKVRAMLAERALRLCAILGYRDLPEIMAERRYGWVNGVMAEGVLDYPIQSRIDWTNRLDAWLTHRWLGLPLFLLTSTWPSSSFSP